MIYVERERISLEDCVTEPDTWAMNDMELYKYIKSKPGYPRNSLVPYAEEVIGLSNCDYLIAMKSSGAIAALSINGGKYRDIEILPDKNQIVWY